ncbi:hypothetical protein PV367_27090 [Streptomyces europaeiscabiei]|uniref:Uncharacterized protein n=1 Tax=Streptomyces europaeiscabiei TaxID=146819 RepID=A0AAJ2PTW2_9ACTN|nr:hypothetical protein [Streptomyces europaeiscabiei]MDX3133362.1 hypothetical protein [Streptomyces europaeiscabiei]
MPCRPPTLDVQTVAELYSQLSGVLAGFALAAVFIVISHFLGEAAPTGRREEALGQALPALLAALLGLVLSSLTYCVVAADGDNPGRALFQHVVAGVGFSVAGALLIFATVLLIEGVLPYDPVHYARRLLGQCVPLPIFALLCDGAYAYGKAYNGGRAPGWLGALIVLLLSSVLAVSVLGYAAYGRPGLDRIRVTGGGATRAIAVSGLSIVTVCLLSVVTTMGLAGTGCSVPIGAVVTVLLCGFLAAVGLCAWLFVTRPARPTAPVPAPTRASVV